MKNLTNDKNKEVTKGLKFILRRNFEEAAKDAKKNQRELLRHGIISAFTKNKEEEIKKEEEEDYSTNEKREIITHEVMHRSKGKTEYKIKKSKGKQKSKGKCGKKPNEKGLTTKGKTKGKGSKKQNCGTESPSITPSIEPTIAFNITNCGSYANQW